MNKVQARKMVLVSTLLLAVIAVYRDRQSDGTTTADVAGGTFRALWGVGLVGFALSLVADFAPGIAGPFAGLVVLGSLTHGGDKVIQTALGKVAATPARTTASVGSAAPAPRPSSPTGTTPAGGPR